ncbi:MAG: ATP-dependent DNA helicase RecG [Spirochaetes bacterium]|nr:ATP-dependent DNA helicase RecG [Spirochaetota bacterium]
MLDQPVTALRGIGPRKAVLLKEEAGIETVEDLLYYIPRRYIDRSYFKSIKDCFVNENVTVAGTIRRVGVSGRGRKFLEVEIDDGTDSLTGVFFAAISFFQKIFIAGDSVVFSGKVTFYRNKQIVHPDFDFVFDDPEREALNTGRIIPLYRSTEKLKSVGFDSRGFRRAIMTALEGSGESIIEPLDDALLGRLNLPILREAIHEIHFPESFDSAERSRKRIAFNELLFHQVCLAQIRRRENDYSHKVSSPVDDTAYREFVASLPFALTGDQVRAIDEIRRDMESPGLMNRLLQGDVGSGKTVVSMVAALFAKSQGRQAALMAPTEILANQHFINFKTLLGDRLRITLLTGTMPAGEKREVASRLADGSIDLAIGTHALIQGGVLFKSLGLIVIDEQHRFGVSQRAALRDKGDRTDLLVMTATPIPRSLTLTLYGNLDVTSIRTIPAGRTPVRTMAFPESRLSGVYRSMEKYIAMGRQVYYVLPMIEDSERIDLKSATRVFEHLRKDIFPSRRVELLHGRMKQDERDTIMERFREGTIDILVCTTVIEVGIDVPNATIIVIEHAERFGLAQLHQLRGRVGRGAHESFCVLIGSDDMPEESAARINTIVRTLDGFEIAEEDLKLRGAGELIGQRQHGHGGFFEFADLGMDMDLIVAAKEISGGMTFPKPGEPGGNEDILSGGLRQNFNGIRTKKMLSLLS